MKFGRESRESSARPVRCTCYLRVSNEENLSGTFTSLDSQRDICGLAVQQRASQGFTMLDRAFQDETSAATTARPGFQALLAAVAAGEVDCVVVYRIDRFCRSLRDLLNIKAELESHGAMLLSATEPDIDTTTANGRLQLNLLGTIAQWESDIASERIRFKAATSKARGKYWGGPPILGYDVDHVNRRLIVNRAEADTVRFIFQRFLVHGSQARIAEELEEAGYKPKSWTTRKGELRSHKPWNKYAICRVLRNCTYIGKTLYHRTGEVFDGEHEAIVDLETWTSVQKKLEQSPEIRSGFNRRKLDGFLRDLLVCGNCGRSMRLTYSGKKGPRLYRYYLCNGVARNGRRACSMPLLPAHALESAVLGELKTIFQLPEVYAGTYRAATAELVGRKADLQGLCQRETSRLATLRAESERLVEEELSTELLERYRALHTQIDESQTRLHDITQQMGEYEALDVTEHQVIDMLASIETAWPLMEPRVRQEIANSVLDRVTVFEDRLELTLGITRLKGLYRELQG